MISTISLTISFLWISIMITYFLLNRKKTNIEWSLIKGIRCISCKEEIPLDEEEFINNNFEFKDGVKICQACERDEKLDQLVDKQHKYLQRKLKLFLISKYYKYFIIIGISLGFLSCGVDIILSIFFGIKGLNILTNSIYIIFWTVMILKMKATTIKKSPNLND